VEPRWERFDLPLVPPEMCEEYKAKRAEQVWQRIRRAVLNMYSGGVWDILPQHISGDTVEVSKYLSRKIPETFTVKGWIWGGFVRGSFEVL
jgi:hypothetical protein